MSDHVDISEAERFDAFPRRGDPWPSDTAGGSTMAETVTIDASAAPAIAFAAAESNPLAPFAAGTITPPTAEPLSPYLRRELAKIARAIEEARDTLRRLRDAS